MTMARTQADLGELMAKVLDRLENEHAGYTVTDAIIVLEIETPEDTPAEEADGTILLQCTSNRASIQFGLLKWGGECVFDGYGED